MFADADLDRLRRGAAALDVTLTATQEQQLSTYVERLLSWNQKLNLTAVTEPAAVVNKHLLDALALVPVVRLRAAAELVDVGAGPGLPSLVLAIAVPGLRVTAVESIQKKATFIRTISRELSLPVEVLATRLENMPEARRFEIAVSRATFEPSEWVERGARLVRPGGLLLAMLSARQAVPEAPVGFVAEPLREHRIAEVPRFIASYLRG